MKFALNYSLPALQFYESGEVALDLFKLPAWPQVVAQVSRIHPCYVHFPLGVGDGSGTITDFEEKSPVRWQKIEQLMEMTGTPLVNIHLAPLASQHPDLPLRDTSPETCSRLIERMSADVAAAVHRFGAENVIVENDTGGEGILEAATVPGVIRGVVEQTGCGFLLDLSHARIVASQRGLDTRGYIAQLPVERLCELHLTGIQWFDQSWADLLHRKGMPESRFELKLGRWMDHLPFTEADWEETAWALAQIHNGAWREPWVASCEYGGIGGGFFEATTDENVIREQMPRLNELIKRKT